MSDEAVRARAREAGIAVDWTDANGHPQQVSVPSLARLLDALGASDDTPDAPLVTATVGQPTTLSDAANGAAELTMEDGNRRSLAIHDGVVPAIDMEGYHRLQLDGREITLAVAPARCLAIADVAAGRKLWGIAVQLYSLRRKGDFGIGDTTGLRALQQEAAAAGADAIALSPAHSLFPADPGRYGPYSPSNRLFFNPLLTDPADALGDARVKAATGDEADPEAPLIDWPTAARAKYDLYRRLFADFVTRDRAQGTALAKDFDAFVREGGPLLDKHARFEARMAMNEMPVEYFLFLQWIADRAFARTQAEARAAGMRIGLVTDLAVGLDPGGSQVGAEPSHFLNGLSIGAPPDLFNPNGQDWGLTTFSPQALVATGFEAFIATLRANMRHAGGVRIDHAMGLKRLWLVPSGGSPVEGAYLSYPMDDLMRLLALESHRNQAVVIGEDLGTVPPDFRERCRAIGMAGMDVLWFQRDGARFQAPQEWRDDAVAMTSTHDLPTVAGWWQGADLDLRRHLGNLSEGEVEDRDRDRTALWQVFEQAEVTHGPPPPSDQPIPAIDAAVAFVAKSPSPLAIVPLEDIIGVADQPNLPGTIDEHPNWRRRFAKPAAELLQEPAAAHRLQVLRDTRS